MLECIACVDGTRRPYGGIRARRIGGTRRVGQSRNDDTDVSHLAFYAFLSFLVHLVIERFAILHEEITDMPRLDDMWSIVECFVSRTLLPVQLE